MRTRMAVRYLPPLAASGLFLKASGANRGAMVNIDDVVKTYEFLGHSPVEVTIIAPATDTVKSVVRECRLAYSVDGFVALCSRWDGKANVYVGLNELRGGYQQQKGHRTSKTDIAAVHFVPVDIDSVRAPLTHLSLIFCRVSSITDGIYFPRIDVDD